MPSRYTSAIPITSIASPLVLSTVGALSVNATLLFTAAVWGVGLVGTFIGSKLIDKIGRRKLCYMSAIPHDVPRCSVPFRRLPCASCLSPMF